MAALTLRLRQKNLEKTASSVLRHKKKTPQENFPTGVIFCEEFIPARSAALVF